MAAYDSADLLARCKLMRRRPSTDGGTTDANWYTMLTEAEAKWKPIIALHYPNAMYSAPELMSSPDGGKQYIIPSLSSNTVALKLLVLESLTGEPLTPGAFWDRSKDYVYEQGDRIRITGGRSRSFSSGPYARYIDPPGTIDASTESTILPKQLRLIIVAEACALDAARGGYDDPRPYEARVQQLAFGDPNIPGDPGLLGGLKAQHIFEGTSALAERDAYAWWRPV